MAAAFTPNSVMDINDQAVRRSLGHCSNNPTCSDELSLQSTLNASKPELQFRLSGPNDTMHADDDGWYTKTGDEINPETKTK